MKEREPHKPSFRERLKRITDGYNLAQAGTHTPEYKRQLTEMYLNQVEMLYEVRFIRTKPSEDAKLSWEASK